MTGADDVGESEPTSFEAALSRLDREVRRRGPRRVTLEKIVEVIRADRDAVGRGRIPRERSRPTHRRIPRLTTVGQSLRE